MERELKNKVAVITGGAQGIGFNIADQFLAEGATVVILDLNEANGEDAAKELKNKHGNANVNFLKCDVTIDLEEIFKQIIDTHEHVDVLVNNAGIVCEDSIRKTIEVNTVATMEWTIKFRELMRKDKEGNGGTIINLSSIYGYRVDPYVAYYKASKFAVFGFSKALGHTLNYEKSGVRILTICPGFTRSSLTAKQLVWDEHVDDFDKFLAGMKWQSAEQVSAAVVGVFKAGDSGTAWVIEGGDIEKL